MHPQGILLDEALAAGFTAEGTLAGVYSLMSFQSVGLVEALSARFALEWFFARVDAQVALQVSWDCEAFAAVVTFIGPLTSVDLLVHF